METEEREVWENLAEWDNLDNPLAPLTEEQQKTILELAALCDHKLSVQDVRLNLRFLSLDFTILSTYIYIIIMQETTESRASTIPNFDDKKHSDTTILDSFASLKSGEKTIESSQQVDQAQNIDKVVL